MSTWQQKLIEKNSINSNVARVKNVGVPWFQDIEFTLPNLKGPSIAVFDYEPHVGYFGISSLNDLGISSIDYLLKFWETIMRLCTRHEVSVLHKPKREIPIHKRHHLYSKQLFALASSDLYFNIPASLAPSRLMLHVSGVVNLLPTSTDIQARELGVPSIYFNPGAKVSEEEPALEAALILSSEEALETWILNISRKIP